jgi:hypothetical protein
MMLRQLGGRAKVATMRLGTQFSCAHGVCDMASANDTYAAASIAAAETTKITAMSTAAHM